MDIKLLKLEKNNDDNNIKYFKLIEMWYADEDIKYSVIPNFEECELKTSNSCELINEFNKRDNKEVYIIVDMDKPIGDISIDYNFPSLAKKDDKSAWISICIGDKNYHGKSVGTIVMNLIENICKEKGMARIELGVFGFNTVAQKLYKKCGYKEIKEIKNFTYKYGTWYSDIRMEKVI